MSSTSSDSLFRASYSDDDDDVSIPESIVPCQYYQFGRCKFANRCRFGHQQSSYDREDPSSSDQAGSSAQSSSNMDQDVEDSDDGNVNMNGRPWRTKPCRYFARGRCIYGDRCSFRHDEPSPAAVAPVPNDQVTPTSPCSPASLEIPAAAMMCPNIEASEICETEDCPYSHGPKCDVCGKAALHPFDGELRQKHIDACIKRQIGDIERSTALQSSREKSCVICLDLIMEKSPRDQRFGILPNCSHCFCIACITQWRKARNIDKNAIRSCPVCRIGADFIYPSSTWIESPEEKERQLVQYKILLSQKLCKRFRFRGGCQFGDKCLYMHR